MKTAQLLQIVFSGALFLATVGLVIVTITYAKATKRMADSIELQSRIAHDEHELAMKPDIFSSFNISVPYGTNNIRYTYSLINNSRRTSVLKKIRVILWKENNPDEKTPFDISDQIMNIPPLGGARVDLPLNFMSIRTIFPDITNLNQLYMQPIFVIEDFSHRDIEFSDYPRKIGE
jgi:hypothetical protein